MGLRSAREWLAAAIIVNSVGIILGFVANRTDEPGWLNATRTGLLGVTFLCLVIAGVVWWRRRSARRPDSGEPGR